MAIRRHGPRVAPQRRRIRQHHPLTADQLRALADRIDRLTGDVNDARTLVQEMLPWVDGDGVAAAWLIDHGTKFLDRTSG